MTYENEQMNLLSAEETPFDPTAALKNVTDTLAAMPDRLLPGAENPITDAAAEFTAVIDDLTDVILYLTDGETMEYVIKWLPDNNKNLLDDDIKEAFRNQAQSLVLIRADIEAGNISYAQAIEQLEEIAEAVTTLNTEINPQAIELSWTPGGFVEQLPNMGIGMLIILLVMCILIGGTTLLNRATAKIESLKKQKESKE